ncbi:MULTISPECIES: FAD-binding protein [unclassified Microbacterium]|uniref:FAD-binding protein n=1 Tax=unclassified Microbacterium TaxID=2609290 RepID=UPI00214AE431|nr:MULTISPECIES: FAD-binding protein [unclassified Microbacterium]MCR2808608.1 FAD-binding protein [Microbacterium sp. zg.B185]WIM18958.1 FAD-binding protein [Microbacterium sp. zg-B185]
MARNWAGSHEYAAPRIVAAATVQDVQRAIATGGRVHALGTRHSFTDLPDTTGTLIDLAPLTGGYELDRDAASVTVAAGTRYGELALWLEQRGCALHNLGSLPHISVAGAIATATHGSGDANGVLTSAVRGIRYIGADGQEREVLRGEPDFSALAVGLGAFGVIVAVTLAVQPTYRVRQDIYRGVSWDAALAGLDAVTGAGYSVSVFTRWDPELIGDVWVKTRMGADDDEVADGLLDGARVAEANPLDGLADLTELGGVPGPWMLRLPHFRLDGTPSFGDELQTEYFVARSDAPAALRAVRELAPVIQPHLFVSELRTAASDDLWLSGAYRRDLVAIHFTWRNDPAGVRGALPHIEAALAPFRARPHWGKLHLFEADDIARVHPRAADARAVFERLDPEGRFVNAHLVRVGLREPRR